MVDTGAAYSCVSSKYASHLPMARKFAKTVGFSGQTQLIPLTAPVTLKLHGRAVTLPILVSETTPVNLIGRDALCKLGTRILCTSEGILIEPAGTVSQMTMSRPKTANVYWVGDMEDQVNVTMRKWGGYIRAQIPQAKESRIGYHCTLMYDPEQDSELENKWQTTAAGKKVKIESQYIIIGPEGAAMTAEDADQSSAIKDWFKNTHAAPHITLLINKGFEAKQLGKMMLDEKQLKWESTDNPLILQSCCGKYLKILCSTYVTGVLEEVEVVQKQQKQLTTEKSHINKLIELETEMLARIPEQVWAKFDTDVGLVQSANPVKIQVTPNAKLPWRNQYYMKPEAVVGIAPTIEGLINAGVLIETKSNCNTPLLPVLKADKQKWRLVHDLRAVNEIVEEMQAEVPNPHTLLTNVPPDAKFFTVIDLCGAFFSVPLAEESRHLFAFTYDGKQYTYTRMPQGFKHSPHVFNKILKNDLEELVLHGTLIQYVDDLLICSPTLEQCHEDSMAVLNKLAIGGHKVSQKKLQYCQSEVEYLGRLVAHQTKLIAPSQLEGISQAPQPQTVRQMMTFLGMTGFSSDWIEDYALKTSPLIGGGDK